jgi:uncharacterized protein (DUF1800 family)
MALTRADAAHLARRTGFGVTPYRLGLLLGAADRDAAVDLALAQQDAPSDQLAPALTPLLPSFPGPQVDLQQLWWLDRMVSSPTQLVEKLTLFWHGHFATAQDKVQDISLLYGQNTTIRRMALGNFHDLAQAMSVDPAMLHYLDNKANVAEEVQENFGRELLEAFTVGPEASSEADVVAMSKAWTGHGLHPSGRTYEFHPEHHDNGPKELFGLPARNWDGPAALTELLYGARAEAASRFVTAKLFSYLAYPATPADPVVERLAGTFRQSGLSIGALVRAILRSEEFWGPGARMALVRSPIEWVVTVLQATAVPSILAEPHVVLRRLGHEPFNPPNVFGWRGQRGWLTTSSVWAKAQWAELVGARMADSGGFAGLEGASPADVTGAGLERFGIVDPSPATFHRIQAWVSAAAELRSEEPKVFLRQFVQLLALSPEAQLA